MGPRSQCRERKAHQLFALYRCGRNRQDNVTENVEQDCGPPWTPESTFVSPALP